MMKAILVPATGSNTDNSVFAAALSVARAFSAHLTFLHVRTDRAGLVEAMAVAGSEALMVPSEFLDRAEGEANERAKRAEEQVRRFCTGENLKFADAPLGPPEPTAEWLVEIGREDAVLVAYAQASDLLVIGRPADGADYPIGTVEAALVETGRPLLLPAPGPITNLPGETIAIAWKPTPQSARAVTAAMPLIEKAKRVVILTVGEGDDTDAQSVAALAAMLRWHGIEVTARRLPDEGSTAVDTLFAAANELGAGLVVMGGYGHSRAREFIFGGFTEQVLRGVGLSVLMCH